MGTLAVLLACASAQAAAANPFLLMRARADLGKSAHDLGLHARLWCAEWLNRLRGASDTDLTARSYLKRPRALPCTIGTIAVLTRGRRGGHVGIVESCDWRGNPTLISGNHLGRVAQSKYSKSRVLAWVQP